MTRSNAHLSCSRTLCHVEAEDQVLVAQVQSAVRNDGVGPDIWPVLAAHLGMLRDREAAMFLPRLRRRFDEYTGPVLLAVAIKTAVGVSNGAAAQLLFL